MVRDDELAIDRGAPDAAMSAEANTKVDRPARGFGWEGGAFRRSSPQGTVRGSVTTRTGLLRVKLADVHESASALEILDAGEGYRLVDSDERHDGPRRSAPRPTDHEAAGSST